MEFKDKLKQLRLEKEWTQEQLAEKLFISRTAISKWESGRGFPSIESLKAISQVFQVSIDDLLSNSELITIAENDHNEQRNRFQKLILGVMDCLAGLLIFLPIFGRLEKDRVAFVSLLDLSFDESVLKISYLILVILIAVFGIFELIVASEDKRFLAKYRTSISLILTLIGTLAFIMTRQPYAASFLLTLLTIKGYFLLNQR